MFANISLFEGKISCNVLGCTSLASFTWHYQHTANHKLVQIAGNNNIIGWFGSGTYYCEVVCNAGSLKVSNTFNSATQTDTQPLEGKVTLPTKIQQQAAVRQNNSEWDFTKIPATEMERIRQLVAGEKWKDLAIIHNNYNLSSNSYCCNMEGVKTNFKKYVKMSGGES
jgi:hypothetical protein